MAIPYQQLEPLVKAYKGRTFGGKNPAIVEAETYIATLKGSSAAAPSDAMIKLGLAKCFLGQHRVKAGSGAYQVWENILIDVFVDKNAIADETPNRDDVLQRKYRAEAKRINAALQTLHDSGNLTEDAVVNPCAAVPPIPLLKSRLLQIVADYDADRGLVKKTRGVQSFAMDRVMGVIETLDDNLHFQGDLLELEGKKQFDLIVSFFDPTPVTLGSASYRAWSKIVQLFYYENSDKTQAEIDSEIRKTYDNIIVLKKKGELDEESPIRLKKCITSPDEKIVLKKAGLSCFGSAFFARPVFTGASKVTVKDLKGYQKIAEEKRGPIFRQLLRRGIPKGLLKKNPELRKYFIKESLTKDLKTNPLMAALAFADGDQQAVIAILRQQNFDVAKLRQLIAPPVSRYQLDQFPLIRQVLFQMSVTDANFDEASLEKGLWAMLLPNSSEKPMTEVEYSVEVCEAKPEGNHLNSTKLFVYFEDKQDHDLVVVETLPDQKDPEEFNKHKKTTYITKDGLYQWSDREQAFKQILTKAEFETRQELCSVSQVLERNTHRSIKTQVISSLDALDQVIHEKNGRTFREPMYAVQQQDQTVVHSPVSLGDRGKQLKQSLLASLAKTRHAKDKDLASEMTASQKIELAKLALSRRHFSAVYDRVRDKCLDMLRRVQQPLATSSEPLLRAEETVSLAKRVKDKGYLNTPEATAAFLGMLPKDSDFYWETFEEAAKEDSLLSFLKSILFESAEADTGQFETNSSIGSDTRSQNSEPEADATPIGARPPARQTVLNLFFSYVKGPRKPSVSVSNSSASFLNNGSATEKDMLKQHDNDKAKLVTQLEAIVFAFPAEDLGLIYKKLDQLESTQKTGVPLLDAIRQHSRVAIGDTKSWSDFMQKLRQQAQPELQSTGSFKVK